MIVLTASEAVAMLPALRRVLAEKLPVQAAYRLSRIAAKLQPELTLFEEQRMALVKELGAPAEEPNMYRLEGANRQEFETRMLALGMEEIKIDLAPLTVDALGESQLAGADLLALEKIIV